MINKPPPFKGLDLRIPITTLLNTPLYYSSFNLISIIGIPMIVLIKGRGFIHQGFGCRVVYTGFRLSCCFSDLPFIH